MNKKSSAQSANFDIQSVRGYTLVEVLITTLIFSIVILSIYSVFHTGRITYKKMDSAFELYQKARIVFNRMDRDLKNSFAYGKSNVEFSGSREGIDFFTILDSFDDAGAVLQKVAQIKYEFLDLALRRTQIEGLDILKDGTPEIAEELLDQLEYLSFQFAAPDTGGAEARYAWQDIWPAEDKNQEKSLPLAVKVEMILGGIKFNKIIPLAQTYFEDDS